VKSVYEAAFVYELEKRKIFYDHQKPIAAIYENVILDVGFNPGVKIYNRDKINRTPGKTAS
jgi:hypothetical protein